ncbi:MAG: Uma2 family endonuclease [Chloroflexia bacterium]|nr:Uma2 family endonuclease [Chloroflexia bacterium]
MVIITTGRVSEDTYRRLALAAVDGPLELHDGVPREKPGMSVEHNGMMVDLIVALAPQLDRSEYRLRANSAKLRRSAARYYVPDIAVIPAALVLALREQPGSLDAYSAPLPLVVEIWSPSTGDYDIAAKLPEYMARGDLEIWYLHPYEQTLLASRRQPDGTYVETRYTHGSVAVHSLPGVEVDLDALFAQ